MSKKSPTKEKHSNNMPIHFCGCCGGGIPKEATPKRRDEKAPQNGRTADYWSEITKNAKYRTTRNLKNSILCLSCTKLMKEESQNRTARTTTNGTSKSHKNGSGKPIPSTKSKKVVEETDSEEEEDKNEESDDDEDDDDVESISSESSPEEIPEPVVMEDFHQCGCCNSILDPKDMFLSRKTTDYWKQIDSFFDMRVTKDLRNEHICDPCHNRVKYLLVRGFDGRMRGMRPRNYPGFTGEDHRCACCNRRFTMPEVMDPLKYKSKDYWDKMVKLTYTSKTRSKLYTYICSVCKDECDGAPRHLFPGYEDYQLNGPKIQTNEDSSDSKSDSEPDVRRSARKNVKETRKKVSKEKEEKDRIAKEKREKEKKKKDVPENERRCGACAMVFPQGEHEDETVACTTELFWDKIIRYEEFNKTRNRECRWICNVCRDRCVVYRTPNRTPKTEAQKLEALASLDIDFSDLLQFAPGPNESGNSHDSNKIRKFDDVVHDWSGDDFEAKLKKLDGSADKDTPSQIGLDFLWD